MPAFMRRVRLCTESDYPLKLIPEHDDYLEKNLLKPEKSTPTSPDTSATYSRNDRLVIMWISEISTNKL